jgi:3-oxoacyl-[acyl-carrier-protein] synthase II
MDKQSALHIKHYTLPHSMQSLSLEAVLNYSFNQISILFNTDKPISLILNCEGIINHELNNFILCSAQSKIRPSLSLNTEACRLANALAGQFNIRSHVETYFLEFENNLIKKRAESILRIHANNIVIACDIRMENLQWEEICIEIYTVSSQNEIKPQQIGITGMGLVTAYGLGQSTFIEQLYTKQILENLYHCSDEITIQSLGEQWLYYSVNEALHEAHLTSDIFQELTTGIIICSRAGSVSDELRHRAPGWLGSRKNWLCKNFSVFCDIYELSAACASISFAMMIAQELITTSHYKRIMIIGVEVPSLFELKSLSILNALSKTMAKPFDSNRDGITLGEGAGAVILESFPAIESHSIKPLAWLRSVKNFIDDESRADISSNKLISLFEKVTLGKSVDAVIAHATGTIKGDMAECEALAQYFAINRLPVISVKGAIGHLLYASAFPSIAVAIAIFAKNKFPAVLRLNNLDPLLQKTNLEFFPDQLALDNSINRILLNNFGFFGCYSSFVLERA